MGLSPAGKLLAVSRSGKGGSIKGKQPIQIRANSTTISSHIAYSIKARQDDGKTHLGYSPGEISDRVVKRCLVDGGSLSERISPHVL